MRLDVYTSPETLYTTNLLAMHFQLAMDAADARFLARKWWRR